MATEGENTGSLAGVRVVDLTRVLSGPFATMLLADQGAEIVKIEPLEGDPTRGFGPWLEEDVEQLHSGYFLSINRNKKSIAVDLRKPEGREIVLRLARDADMLVENFRPGVMERLGLSYETLAKENPRLVYGALRGFGDPRSGESPYAGWPAFDVVAQAMGGIMGITGPDAATPTKVGPGVGDLVPALFLAVGLLSALHRARETGRGQFVDIAMYDAIVALCERMVYQYSFTGKPPHPEGNSHPILCPFGLFPVSDGLVSVGCPQDSFWAALCREIGDPALADDPRFATGRARIARRAETEALVASWTRPFDKAGLVARLGGKVPVGPLNTAADIFADPHVEARGMLAEIALPGIARKPVIANSPLRHSAARSGVRSRAPLLGEHGREILVAAGYGTAEIAALEESGVVAAPTEPKNAGETGSR